MFYLSTGGLFCPFAHIELSPLLTSLFPYVSAPLVHFLSFLLLVNACIHCTRRVPTAHSPLADHLMVYDTCLSKGHWFIVIVTPPPSRLFRGRFKSQFLHLLLNTTSSWNTTAVPTTNKLRQRGYRRRVPSLLCCI